MLNSFDGLCITQVAAINPFARVLDPREQSVYIARWCFELDGQI